MKKILFSLLLAVIAVGASAREIAGVVFTTTANDCNSDSDKKVIECNLSKAKLWTNLKKWIAKEFVSYKYSVDMEDREGGTIVIKFNSYEERGAGAFVDLTLNATLQIDVKDNKYRYSISDASYELKPNSICNNISYLSGSSAFLVGRTEQ